MRFALLQLVPSLSQKWLSIIFITVIYALIIPHKLTHESFPISVPQMHLIRVRTRLWTLALQPLIKSHLPLSLICLFANFHDCCIHFFLDVTLLENFARSLLSVILWFIWSIFYRDFMFYFLYFQTLIIRFLYLSFLHSLIWWILIDIYFIIMCSLFTIEFLFIIVRLINILLQFMIINFIKLLSIQNVCFLFNYWSYFHIFYII